MKTIFALTLVFAFAPLAHAQMQISIGVRETDAGGGPSGAIGSDGGTLGGIEWVDRDEQTLIFDGTWQLFTFEFSTADYLAFAGSTANSILDGDFGVLEHIRILNSGGIDQNVTIWIDGLRNTITPAGGPPVTTIFGSFEGYNNGDEVIFQEPGFSGSTASNVAPFSTAGVDNSVAHTGNASYALNFQFVDNDPSRWIRLTTFGSDNLLNPLIRFDQSATVSFWMMGVIPEPGTMLAIGLLGMRRRRRRS